MQELDSAISLEKVFAVLDFKELLSKLDSSTVMTRTQHKNLIQKSSQLEQASNRWTENVVMLQGWCRDKFMMSGQDFCNAFQVPDDLDVEF